MVVRQGSLTGLLIIEHELHIDQRGFFLETVPMDELEAAVGARVNFVQINHSHSQKGVLRGLHSEDWEKLVYVPHGEVMTAVADIRPESPTFGKVQTFRLGAENRCMLFIPRKMAHGWCAISDEADYIYLVTKYYDGSDLQAVAWNDPDLAVPWPVANPTLSERDRNNPSLRQLFPDRRPDR